MNSAIPVTLLFADGVSQRLDVACGQSLVEAATASGLNLLTDCANGQCGTCTAQLLSGEVELEDYDPAVLPDDEREAGVILPCICHVKKSCVVEFPYDSSEALSEEAPPIAGEVVSIARIAAEIMRLEITVNEKLIFEPGQYVRIQPEGTEISRSYSMANLPGSNRLEFYIRLVPDGAFSNWLLNTQVGDKVALSAPHGTFFLRDEARPRLFVAGGSGMAPFLSMLRAMKGHAQSVPTTILIGARTPEHLFALEELQRLRSDIPQLEVKFVLEEGECPDSHTGYPTDLICRLGLDCATRIYLCGPPPMVEAGRAAAHEAGLSRSDVLCERFN